jgi:hypothetical protein
MRRLVPAIAVPILLLSCGHGPVGGLPNSGVRGDVVLGPTCPVEIAGSPCPDRPWQGTVQAFTLSGALVRDASTDAQGAFELPLDPGTYDLIPYTPQSPPTAKMQRVTVTSGAFVAVTLQLDTGIR